MSQNYIKVNIYIPQNSFNMDGIIWFSAWVYNWILKVSLFILFISYLLSFSVQYKELLSVDTFIINDGGDTFELGPGKRFCLFALELWKIHLHTSKSYIFILILNRNKAIKPSKISDIMKKYRQSVIKNIESNKFQVFGIYE